MNWKKDRNISANKSIPFWSPFRVHLMAKTVTKVPSKKAAAPKAAAKASTKAAKPATSKATTKTSAKTPAKAPTKKAVSKASAGGAGSVLTLRNIAEGLSETHEVPKRRPTRC
jgi:DNA-binding protein HU-beta